MMYAGRPHVLLYRAYHFLVVTCLMLSIIPMYDLEGDYQLSAPIFKNGEDVSVSQGIAKSGRILYVSPNGSTYNNPQDAVNNSTKGDIIIIGNGTYETLLIIDNVSDITIIGNSSEDCQIKWIDPSSVPLYNPVIYINHSQNITLKNINVTSQGDDISGILIESSDNVTLESINIFMPDLYYNENIRGIVITGISRVGEEFVLESENIQIANTTFHMKSSRYLIAIEAYAVNLSVKDTKFSLHGGSYIKGIVGTLWDSRIVDVQYFAEDSSGLFIWLGGKNIEVYNCNVTMNGDNNMALCIGDGKNMYIHDSVVTLRSAVDCKAVYSLVYSVQEDYYISNITINIYGSRSTAFAGDTANYTVTNPIINLYGEYFYEFYLEEYSTVRVINYNVSSYILSQDSKIFQYNYVRMAFRDEFGRPFSGGDYYITHEGRRILASIGYGGKLPRLDDYGRTPEVLLNTVNYFGTSTLYPENLITVLVDRERNITDSFRISPIAHELQTFTINLHPPQIPQNFTAYPIPNTQDVLLKWSQNLDDTIEYFVYTNRSGNWTLLINTSENYTYHKNLDEDEIVWYKIRAYDGRWFSDNSSAVSVKTYDITPPMPPTNISIGNITSHMAWVSWDSSKSSDVMYYVLYMNKTNSETEFRPIKNTTGTMLLLDNLSPDTRYIIAVRAIDDSDNPSDLSEMKDFKTYKDTRTLKVRIFFPENYTIRDISKITLTTLENITITEINRPTNPAIIEDVPVGIPLRLVVVPAEDSLAIINVKSGLLPTEVLLDPLTGYSALPPIYINLTMRYYIHVPKPTCMIIGHVDFTKSPSSVYIKHFIVKLYDFNGNLINETYLQIDKDFTFKDVPLPFSGYIQIIPPDEIRGEISVTSGYLTFKSELFNLSIEQRTFYIDCFIKYYRRIIYVFTTIESYQPSGNNVPVDSDITIIFNHTINELGEMISNVISVENTSIVSILFTADGKGVIVRVSDLEEGATYTVEINGTIQKDNDVFYVFPLFTWSFTTATPPKTHHEEEGNEQLLRIGLPTLLIVGIIFVVLYLYLKRVYWKGNKDSSSSGLKENNEQERAEE